MFKEILPTLKSYPFIIWSLVILLGKEGIIINEETFVILSFFFVAYFLDKNLSELIVSALDERVTYLRNGYVTVISDLAKRYKLQLLSSHLKWRYLYDWASFLSHFHDIVNNYIQNRKLIYVTSLSLETSDRVLLMLIIKSYLAHNNYLKDWAQKMEKKYCNPKRIISILGQVKNKVKGNVKNKVKSKVKSNSSFSPKVAIIKIRKNK